MKNNSYFISRQLSIKIKATSFVAIMLVMFIHSFNVEGILYSKTNQLSNFCIFIEQFISQGIARIAVPFFFIVSGFLFFNNYQSFRLSFKTKMVKRIKSLLIPFFLCSIFWFLVFYLLQQLPSIANLVKTNRFDNITFYGIIKIIVMNPIPYQLWFVRDLFILCLLAPFIFHLISKFKYFIVVLVLLWFFDLNIYVMRVEALFGFYLGAQLAIRKFSIPLDIFKKNAYILFFLWLILIILKILFFPETGFHRITILVGLIAFWFLFDKIKSNSLIKYDKLYNYSFFMFLTHEPFLNIIQKFLEKYMGDTISLRLFIYFLSILTTLFFTYTAGIILKKHAGRLYLIITGGR